MVAGTVKRRYVEPKFPKSCVKGFTYKGHNMANTVGSKIQAVLVSILIALLVLAFAVWGINDVFSPSSKQAVLKVGDSEITTQEFDAAFRRELTTLARTEGRQLPHQEAYDRGIHRQVMQNLLGSKVIELDADDLGIGVNGTSARAYISDIEGFQNELTGKFSETKLNEVLSMQRPAVSRMQFEADLIKTLRQEQTVPAINGGVVAPLQFAEQRYQYLTEQRKAKVLNLNIQAIPPAPEPTDADLEDYIAQNPIRFTAPEYRRVTLIRLEEIDMIPDLNVTEQDIQDLYDYKVDLGELGAPETRSVAQITATNEKVANEAVERLAKGEDPKTVALLMNLIEPIEFESVIETTITDPITGEAAFAMAEGEANAVLGSFGNWYAVVVTKVNAAVEPDIEVIREDLKTELLKNKAQEKLFDTTPKVEDVLDENGTIEEAAEAAGVPYTSIDFIDRSGATQDNQKLEGIGDNTGLAEDENILKEVFINDIGYATNMFQTSSGGWAVLRVDDVLESQLRPFDEVKPQATAMWKTQKLNEALDTLMRDLASRAQTGESLDVLLTDTPNGATLDEVILLRSAPNPLLGRAVTVNLLDASVGDVERGEGPQPLTRQVAVLTDIVENLDGLAGQYADILQDQTTAALRSDLTFAYQQAVLKDNPVQEFQENVRSTLGLDALEE